MVLPPMMPHPLFVSLLLLDLQVRRFKVCRVCLTLCMSSQSSNN